MMRRWLHLAIVKRVCFGGEAMTDPDLTKRASEGRAHYGASMDDGRKPELLITVREAAERTQLSKDTIYKLIAAGQFPYKRIGGVLRVPVRALEKWAEPDVE